MQENLALQPELKINQDKNHKTLQTTKRTKILLFLFIITVSIYLRLPGIYHGLPYITHPNEANNVLQVISLSRFQVDSFDSSSFFIFLNSLFAFISSGTIDLNHLIDILEISQGAFYIPFRLISVLFGIGSVILLYLIGRIFSHSIAVFASSFLAISLLHIKYSQLFLPFSSMVFFSLLATFFAIKSLEKNKLNALPAGICALLSASMHYVGLVSFVSILIVCILKKKPLKKYIGIALISFLVLNPTFIVNLIGFIKYLITSYLTSFIDYKYSSSLHSVFSTLFMGVGPLVWLGAMAFIFTTKHHSLNTLAVVFSVPCIYLGIISLCHLTSSSYSMLLVPYVCLAAAFTFSWLQNMWGDPSYGGEKYFIYLVIVLFSIWIPLKYSLKYNKIMSLSDTRAIATDWINQNAGGDVKIAWDKNSLQLHWFNAYDKKKLESLGIDPDLISSSEEYKLTPKLLKQKEWLRFLRRKVDYVVVDSLDKEMILRGKKGDPLIRKYYSKLSKLKPVISFNPYLREYDKGIHTSQIEDLYSPYHTLWKRERSGPVIRIYKL